MILEGSYPYVFGGVSSWTHQYMQAMKEHEFVLWCIGAQSKDKDKFKYKLPDNVVEVHQVFLDDALRMNSQGRMHHTACIADFNLRGKYGLEHFI